MTGTMQLLEARIHPADLEANTDINEEYMLDEEVQKGGMSIIRFGLNSVGERMVIKFCGEQDSYEREVSSLQRIQGLGPSVNTSNIIRMIDYINAEEEDDWYPYSIVVLECGDMSLLSWAASSNRRPDIISGLEAMKKVGLEAQMRQILLNLKAKSYISGDLHTKSFAGMMKSWQKEPVSMVEDKHGEWIIPDYPEGPLSVYASYVRHKDCRRLWALSGWGRGVSKGAMLDALKQHLAADALVQEVLSKFIHTFFPDEKESKLRWEEQLISIEEVNKIFPEKSVDVSMGDWILYRVHKRLWCRMYW
ncbi:MAG: hypothetical protein DHS80DRAFT_32613 [Piptocephalis tieghemiana]|nr:MAG: hypothetical protein DHS80DRAFT_32613 [Piptocephalis tieghemiana]